MASRKKSPSADLVDDLFLPPPPAAALDDQTSEVSLPPPDFEDQTDLGLLPKPAPFEDEPTASEILIPPKPRTPTRPKRSVPPKPQRGKTDMTRTAIGLISAVFDGLSLPALKSLFREMVRIEFAADELLFADGEPPGPLYLVVEGQLRVRSNKRTSSLLGVGSLVGFRSCVLTSTRVGTVSTTEPTEVLALPAARLELLCAKFPELKGAINRRLMLEVT